MSYFQKTTSFLPIIEKNVHNTGGESWPSSTGSTFRDAFDEVTVYFTKIDLYLIFWEHNSSKSCLPQNHTKPSMGRRNSVWQRNLPRPSGEGDISTRMSLGALTAGLSAPGDCPSSSLNLERRYTPRKR